MVSFERLGERSTLKDTNLWRRLASDRGDRSVVNTLEIPFLSPVADWPVFIFELNYDNVLVDVVFAVCKSAADVDINYCVQAFI